MNEPDRETIELIHHLRKLQPARADLNMREVFYRAGFEACRSQTRHHQFRPLLLAVTAAMLGVLITGPLGYLTGRRSAEKHAPASLSTNEQTGLSSGTQDERDTGRASPDRFGEGGPSPSLSEARQPAAPLRPDELHSAQTLATTRFPNWLDPLGGIAKSADLNRQSQTTLSMSHTSRLLLASALQDLSEVSVVNNDLERFAMTQSIDSIGNSSDATMVGSMLSVKDLQTIALDGEASR